MFRLALVIQITAHQKKLIPKRIDPISMQKSCQIARSRIFSELYCTIQLIWTIANGPKVRKAITARELGSAHECRNIQIGLGASSVSGNSVAGSGDRSSSKPALPGFVRRCRNPPRSLGHACKPVLRHFGETGQGLKGSISGQFSPLSRPAEPQLECWLRSAWTRKRRPVALHRLLFRILDLTLEARRPGLGGWRWVDSASQFPRPSRERKSPARLQG